MQTPASNEESYKHLAADPAKAKVTVSGSVVALLLRATGILSCCLRTCEPLVNNTKLCTLLQWPKVLNAPLSEVDPELEDIIEHEKNRQWKVCGR